MFLATRIQIINFLIAGSAIRSYLFRFCTTLPPFHKELFLLLSTCRVTIMKDRKTRESKGVAFILYANRDDAHKAVSYWNYQLLRFSSGLS